MANGLTTPPINSRWMRPGYDAYKGRYNGYRVMYVTNIAHLHANHPPQVVYTGDNGHMWSLPLSEWPGKLVVEVEPKESSR